MTNKPKLCIVTTVPITLKGILNGQPKCLSSVYDIILISSPDVELAEVGSSEQLPTYSVPMERGISLLKDVVSLFNMTKFLFKHKPDAVHSYTPKAGLITMLAGFIVRVPVRIHTFTGLIFPTSTGVKKLILMWMDRLICACATTIVPEGEGVKQDLLSKGITTKQLNVIGNGNIAGVDTDYFSKASVAEESSEIRRKLSIRSNAFVFCFVGRFTQEKGFNELLSAFKQLPNNAYLLLVGDQDERLPLIQSIVDELEAHPRVLQAGWVNDVRPLLAISNVLVLPSYREGFPNTPLQAGSMGIPSIVTNINGCNEIIQNGFNGWVVEPKSSAELAQAMLDAMKFEDIDQLGISARNNIRQKFERSFYLEELKKFYKQQFSEVTQK
ncbi:glycosyltransferase family 4 protein [Vibrio sp. OPT18]|nr:glycosyltransferase family 4 protein [Vibrio sp. OPT18]